MIFSYFDAMSGEPIYVPYIGHIKSPKIKDIYPSSGIGYKTYTLYLHFVDFSADEMAKYAMTIGKGSEAKTCKTIFDLALIDESTRELLGECLSFFMVENVVWDDGFKCFLAKDGESNIGAITKDNFKDVVLYIQQMNYHKLDANVEQKFSSDEARERWERAQKFQKNSAVSEQDIKRMDIGNIISKVCAYGVGYTLMNIGELTVFQLYDQFRQISYLRSSHLSDRVFSIHGGENYDINDWLNQANEDY